VNASFFPVLSRIRQQHVRVPHNERAINKPLQLARKIEKRKAENAIFNPFLYFIESAMPHPVSRQSRGLRVCGDLFRISSSSWAREHNILTGRAGASAAARAP